MNPENRTWLYQITPSRSLLDFNLREIWRYRDLLLLFIRRDITTVYKQTVLGPLWFLIQPLFTSVVFTLVFNNIANIKTGSVPPFLFNLAGITAWNYFTLCFSGTSNTFTVNANLFGKVYFPRAIVPIAVGTSNLVKFSIQLLIFVACAVYFISTGTDLSPGPHLALFPVYVLMLGMIGLGLGMTVSAFAAKYRDLHVLISFMMQLLLYLSAVPYPLSEASRMGKLGWIVQYNPITHIIEGFRFILLNNGTFSWQSFFATLGISVFVFITGLLFFNRAEKNFIDTV